MGKPTRWQFTIVLAAALSIAACGDDDNGNSAPTYDFSAFESEIEAFIGEQPTVDGVGAILVHRDHGVIFERNFGTFTDGQISLVASSSKTVSVGVLMKLVDQGLLYLDEPIVDIVGWGDDNATITPAQLVSNSSGLVGLGPNPGFGPYLCQYLDGGTLQACAETIFTTEQDDDMVIPPDTEFRYGGGQWQVAGGIAEIVSGKSWDELVRETFVEPCGLQVLEYNNHFTQISNEDGNPFGYPSGFNGDPSTLRPTDNPNIEGGLYTTLGDYGQLLLMQLRGGMCGDNRVLSEESLRRMQEDRVGPAYGADTGFGLGGYGLGWWVIGDALVADPGAYGAFPWIDQGREYAGFLLLEATSNLGNELFDRTYEIVNEAIESAG